MGADYPQFKLGSFDFKTTRKFNFDKPSIDNLKKCHPDLVKLAMAFAQIDQSTIVEPSNSTYTVDQLSKSTYPTKCHAFKIVPSNSTYMANVYTKAYYSGIISMLSSVLFGEGYIVYCEDLNNDFNLDDEKTTVELTFSINPALVSKGLGDFTFKTTRKYPYTKESIERLRSVHPYLTALAMAVAQIHKCYVGKSWEDPYYHDTQYKAKKESFPVGYSKYQGLWNTNKCSLAITIIPYVAGDTFKNNHFKSYYYFAGRVMLIAKLLFGDKFITNGMFLPKDTKESMIFRPLHFEIDFNLATGLKDPQPFLYGYQTVIKQNPNLDKYKSDSDNILKQVASMAQNVVNNVADTFVDAAQVAQAIASSANGENQNVPPIPGILRMDQMRRVVPRIGQYTLNCINKYLQIYGMTDKTSICIFLGICSHETGGWTKFNEDGKYKAANMASLKFGKDVRWINPSLVGQPLFTAAEIAAWSVKKGVSREVNEANAVRVLNRRYGHKNKGSLGNKGGIDSPDGYTYRGGGAVQVTGRFNYEKYAKFFNMSVETYSAWIRTIDGAINSALRYFVDYAPLMNASRTGNITVATKIVNGGYNGLAERTSYYNKFMSTLTI